MDHPAPSSEPEASDSPRPRERLDSWKDIAAYFGRDVRTVRRWERTEALPVHRHLHRARGSVYAFRDELNQWLAGRAVHRPPVRGQGRAWRSSLVLLVGGVLVASVTVGVMTIHRFLPPAVPLAREGGWSATQTLAAATWPSDPEVREKFLLARHLLDRRTGQRQQALESLEFVCSRAPDFAPAYALLGEAYVRQALYTPARRTEAWRRAETAVRRALHLDSRLAAAHTVLGRILLMRDWDWATARAEILRAIELDPDAVDARTAYALYLRSAGRPAEAIAERLRVQRVDPLNPQWLVFLGDEYVFARRYDEAVSAYQRALVVERDYRPAVVGLADALERSGRHEEAATWHLRSLRLAGREDRASGFDAVRRREGYMAAVRWLDRQNLAAYQRDVERFAWRVAYTHARLGEREAALHSLEFAFTRRGWELLQARVDPDLDSLRDNPRFVDLLRRIGPTQ